MNRWLPSPGRLCVLLLLIACEHVDTGTPGQHAGCPVEHVADVPVLVIQGMPFVEARIDDRPAFLLLDTGAAVVAVTPAGARRLGLPRSSWLEHSLIRGAGGSFATDDATIEGLEAAGVWFVGPRIRQIPVVPFPVTEIAGRTVDGFLGGEFLAQFEVDLDIPQRRLWLYRPVAECHGDHLPPWAFNYAPVAGSRYLSDRPLIPLKLDGKPMDALVDTGTRATMVIRSRLRPAGVHDDGSAAGPARKLVGVDLTPIEARVHRFALLSVGPGLIRDPAMLVADVPFRGWDIHLGMDYLRLHRVWLSYRTGRVFIAGE